MMRNTHYSMQLNDTGSISSGDCGESAVELAQKSMNCYQQEI